MKESVAIAKEAAAKKDFSATKNHNSIHRVRNELERQLGSLRGVVDDIRRDGGKPSVESFATQLSGMHTTQRAPALLALQQTHGNRYVQRVVSGIQAKLVVGQPGDIYEQEADRVAERVMRMSEPQPQQQQQNEEEEEPTQAKLISSEHPILQRQEEGDEVKPIMTKSISRWTQISEDLHIRLNRSRGGGQPLPEANRNFMERRFGIDFSGVRVHTDSNAIQMSIELNALAFTHGRDIYFGAGRYNPSTSSGKRLLAHELTHVVQQRNSGENIRHVLQRAPDDAVRALNVAVDEWDNTVREFPPCSNRGPEVDKYLAGRRGRGTVVHNGIRYRCGQPWCAYFIKWCLNRAGIPNGVGGAADSVKDWGERMGWYHEINSGFRPIRGDIFFKQPSPSSSHPCDNTRHPCISAGGSGHAGFVLGDWGSFVTTIEGNVHIAGTNNDGVSSKARPLSQLEGVVRIP